MACIGHAGLNVEAWILIYTHVYTHTRTRKICFWEPSVPCEKTVITGMSKLNGWPILEVRYLGCKSMKLKKILRGFQEYDFDFKISNWATRITSFTCSTFLLLTESLFRIFYKIEKLKKKRAESAYSRNISIVHESCIALLQFAFFPTLFGLRDIRRKHLKWFVFVQSEVTPPKEVVKSSLKMELES